MRRSMLRSSLDLTLACIVLACASASQAGFTQMSYTDNPGSFDSRFTWTAPAEEETGGPGGRPGHRFGMPIFVVRLAPPLFLERTRLVVAV